ncbi:hypothetical protein Salat_1706200 [Sesamum alatum]|uniref:CCHC-type domain-containing protein n=1 Tax=Sesamum alatum TaxID=300844 RepID=A0AAE1Y7I1_9LAMI|nr:hypothetical protein Salat_1706200 [Sesamum alatum]
MNREIDRMARTISFNAEEEQGLIIPNELWPGGSTNYALTLVGRVVSNRGLNFEALSSTFRRAAMPGKGMEFTHVGFDRFLLTFQHLGIVKEVLPLSGFSASPCLKVRISLDIQKPLLCCTKIRTTNGKELTVNFHYARLGIFCYLCGVLGHMAKHCDLQYADDFQDPGLNTPYRPWLRAMSKPRGSFPLGPTGDTRPSSSLRGRHIFGGFSSPSFSIRPHASRLNETFSPGNDVGIASPLLPVSDSSAVQSTAAPSVIGESLVNIPLVLSTPSSPNQGCSSSGLLHRRGRRGRCATGSRVYTGGKRKSAEGVVIASSPKRPQSDKATSSSVSDSLETCQAIPF